MYKILLAFVFVAVQVAGFAQKKPSAAEEAESFFAQPRDFFDEARKNYANAQRLYEAGTLPEARAAFNKAKFFASIYCANAPKPVDLLCLASADAEVPSGVEYKIHKPSLKYIMADPELLDEFVGILAPEDDLKNVYEILGKIWDSDEARFKKYPRLALAIAIVFDTPPSENWPHAQVPAKVLPRKFPDCTVAFKIWCDSRESGKFLIQTERLSIEELKFLVSSLACDEDRAYVAQKLPVNLAGIDRLYQSVSYAHARLEARKFVWGGSDYLLRTIKNTGGICVDQAYYTCEAAKCKGVPSFIFSGAGSEGFHAWSAYMLRPGQWNFGVGRYRESRFVTGITIDPQTWKTASDHVLDSLRQSFRQSAKYRLNMLHTDFARLYFKQGNFPKCDASIRAAIAADPRNSQTWDLSVESAISQKKSSAEMVALYAAAMRAFSRQSDLDALYRRKLVDEYRALGDFPSARKLVTGAINKNRKERPDIAMDFARSEIELDIKNRDAENLTGAYKRLLNTFKAEGAICVNGILVPILNSMLRAGMVDETAGVMKITRKTFKNVEGVDTVLNDIDSQLENIRRENEKKKSAA